MQRIDKRQVNEILHDYKKECFQLEHSSEQHETVVKGRQKLVEEHRTVPSDRGGVRPRRRPPSCPRLGARFDIKACHEVLRVGRLPLVVLAQVVRTRVV